MPGDPADPLESAADREFAALLPGALRGAAEAFPPVGVDLAGRGWARGRRLRRNRNLRVGAAAAAMVALIGGGAYALGGVGGRPDDSPVSVASQRSATPSALPSTAAETGPATGEQLVAMLRAVLPQGGTATGGIGRGTQQDPKAYYAGGWAELLYATGEGTSLVRVSLTKAMGPGSCPPEQPEPGMTCEAAPRPGGTLITKRTAQPGPVARTGVHVSAAFIRPDGSSVMVSAAVAGGVPDGKPAPKLVVSAEQVAAMAQDPVWQPAAAYVAQSTPAGDRNPGSLAADAGAMLELLRSRLPQTLTTTEQYRQPGYVALQLDDGKGRSFLGVNVREGQFGSADLKCAPHAISCTPSMRPDATRLNVMEIPNDKAGTCRVRLAEAQRADGLIVSVRLVDASAESLPPTRSSPILTPEQLRDLAADPAWATLPQVTTPGR